MANLAFIDVDHFIVQIHVRWKNVVDLQKNKFDSGKFPTVGFEPFVSIFFSDELCY